MAVPDTQSLAVGSWLSQARSRLPGPGSWQPTGSPLCVNTPAGARCPGSSEDTLAEAQHPSPPCSRWDRWGGGLLGCSREGEVQNRCCPPWQGLVLLLAREAGGGPGKVGARGLRSACLCIDVSSEDGQGTDKSTGRRHQPSAQRHGAPYRDSHSPRGGRHGGQGTGRLNGAAALENTGHSGGDCPWGRVLSSSL